MVKPIFPSIAYLILYIIIYKYLVFTVIYLAICSLWLYLSARTFVCFANLKCHFICFM